jgi:hypothetical protein
MGWVSSPLGTRVSPLVTHAVSLDLFSSQPNCHESVTVVTGFASKPHIQRPSIGRDRGDKPEGSSVPLRKYVRAGLRQCKTSTRCISRSSIGRNAVIFARIQPDPVAQRIERRTSNPNVPSSNLGGVAIFPLFETTATRQFREP